MGYIEHLQKTLDYIEDHLKESITIEDCARISGFSKFHFHRLFGIHLNIPLMEYVRKRRLAYAMLDVVQGIRILDIALEYGYSSERSFSRAFQQEFGQQPSRCRSAKYSLPPRPLLGELSAPDLGGDNAMNYFSEVSITDLGDMRVASAVRVGTEPEDEVSKFVKAWAAGAGIEDEARRFGFDVPVDEELQAKGQRGYEYWVVVMGEQQPVLGEGMVLKDIEGCKYARLRIADPFADPIVRIPQGWKQLAAWVNGRGYQASCVKERYWLEEVIASGGEEAMDIYFPIE